MKFIPNAVSGVVARQLLKTQKNSPAILFGAGVVSAVASTVLACKATLRVEDILDEAAQKMKDVNELRAQVETGAVPLDRDNKPMTYTEMDAKKDKTYVTIRTAVALGRLYAPSIILGVGAIAFFAGAQRVLNNRNAALTAAYATLDRGFKEYRKRVQGEVGEDRERELYRDVRERVDVIDPETGKKTKLTKVVNGGSVYARLFDENNKNWEPNPEVNFFFLRCQQNYANDRLKAKGHVFLNEVYDWLGLDRTPAGSVVGWLDKGDGDGYIDFGIFDEKNSEKLLDLMTGAEKCIWLDFNVDGTIYDKI